MTSLKVREIESKEISPRLDSAALVRDAAIEFNKKGLFIGGAAKSGTTLLMSLLDNHPQLVVLPEETHYLEERRNYLALENHEAKLQYLLEKGDLMRLGMGLLEPQLVSPGADARNYAQFDHKYFVALARDLINRPWMNDSLLLSEVVRAYGIVAGSDCRNCVRWIEKSTSNEVCADALDEFFSDAKVIQIVRDPRAVFASRKSHQVKSRGYYTKAHRLAREWNRNAREIPRLRRDPSRFLVVRYEDLVRHPRMVLGEICQFGGFDFSEKMLEPTRAGNGWQGNSAFYKAFEGISAAPVDKWKDCLTEDEIWWIESHCRKGMELANYSFQTDARFSLRRWLKRLPGESWFGYIRARRASLCQGLGLLKECRYGDRV